MNRYPHSFFSRTRAGLGAVGLFLTTLACQAGESPNFTTTKLRSAADGESTYPLFMNGHGEIVGYFCDADENVHPCVWRDAASVPVKLPSGDDFDRYAYGCNDAGVIVGYYETVFREQACYWASAKAAPIELKSPAGALRSNAYAISSRGEIVGCAKDVLGNKRACYWRDHRAKAVSLATPLDARSYAYSINAAGVIVGHINTEDGEEYACLWPSAHARPVKLPSPAGAKSSYAWSIDEAGRIVGYYETSDGVERLCIWPDKDSRPVPASLPAAPDDVLHVTPEWALGSVNVGGRDEPRLWRRKGR